MADLQAPDKDKRRGVRDGIRKLGDIVSLTQQEKALILCILLSLAAGATIQHCRRVYRETHPLAVPGPTPSLRAKDLYLLDKDKTR
jgi:hypothetical protein